MKTYTMPVNGMDIPIFELDAAVVGSGCAGLNAADSLWNLGCKNIAIITEGINRGTSRNAGSDKQTYYKLSLASDCEDSVLKMAESLFNGGGMHGDIALAEAAGSVRSFMKLVQLGVAFPTNRYGEYVGYKTDHDPLKRATSAGPLTSKFMVEALEKSVKSSGIPILDGMLAFRLLAIDGEAAGLLCLNKREAQSKSYGLCAVLAKKIILATGGPADCYADSVYPLGQHGMTGMALEAGAAAANLNEWQYGLASLKFRWNVSGTYQQVLPRYFSQDANGNEREFLPQSFKSATAALDMTFLKGYQWPFDVKKIPGSSQIDQFVHAETSLGRKVFLDYRKNPAGLENGFSVLGQEAFEYLQKSGVLFGMPIERLAKMNPQAIALYKAHGIDIAAEPLEIAVCAQHHNGGLAVDCDWQTGIRGLYAAGEAAGTFGAHRPGGAALNSTQVGSLRAAEHIAYGAEPFTAPTQAVLSRLKESAEEFFSDYDVTSSPQNGEDVQTLKAGFAKRMSLFAAHMRNCEEMDSLQKTLEARLHGFCKDVKISTQAELVCAVKTRDTMLTQLAVLSAMLLSAQEQGSHGSALVQGEQCPPKWTPESFIETKYENGKFVSKSAPVRGIPQDEDWFENVWAEFCKRRQTGAL